jgi:hypothetical protein
MAFPWAVAAPAELPVGAFDAPAVVADSVLAVAGGADPEAGGTAAEAAFDGSAVATGCTLVGAGDNGPEAGDAPAEPADAFPRLVR